MRVTVRACVSCQCQCRTRIGVAGFLPCFPTHCASKPASQPARERTSPASPGSPASPPAQPAQPASQPASEPGSQRARDRERGRERLSPLIQPAPHLRTTNTAPLLASAGGGCHRCNPGPPPQTPRQGCLHLDRGGRVGRKPEMERASRRGRARGRTRALRKASNRKRSAGDPELPEWPMPAATAATSRIFNDELAQSN